MDDDDVGDLLERLLRRGRLPLGVIDTRPARARVARWLAWQQRHDALSARLLARGVRADEQANAPAPQMPRGLSAWVMPPAAAPVAALPLPDAPRARPSEREAAAGPRLRIRRAPLSAALPPLVVKAQPPAPTQSQPVVRDGASAVPPARAQTLAATVHAAPALPAIAAAQRPVAAGSSLPAPTPATRSPGLAQGMSRAPAMPPLANTMPVVVQPLRALHSTPQRALPLVSEQLESARDAAPRVVALPLRATAHTALVPSAQPASPALVSVPTAPAAAAPRAGAELPQQAAKEPPLQALVERVSRLVLRRLEIEFERRGGRPWR